MQASFYTKSKFFLKEPKNIWLCRRRRENFSIFGKKKAKKGENVSISGKKGKNVILKAKKVKKVIIAKKVKKYVFMFLPFFPSPSYHS